VRHSAVRFAAVAAACLVIAAVAAPLGQADPTNARSLPFTFSCAGGAFEYTGIAISNNHSYLGHVIAPASNAVFVVAQTLVDGVVVPMRDGLPDGIPGLLGRPDLVTCDLIAIDGQDATGLGISTIGFFTSSL
jgi:hypothetical protein